MLSAGANSLPLIILARFQIDPLSLPADVTIPTVEKTMVIRDHSGFLIYFPIQPISAADVELVDV